MISGADFAQNVEAGRRLVQDKLVDINSSDDFQSYYNSLDADERNYMDLLSKHLNGINLETWSNGIKVTFTDIISRISTAAASEKYSNHEYVLKKLIAISGAISLVGKSFTIPPAILYAYAVTTQSMISCIQKELALVNNAGTYVKTLFAEVDKCCDGVIHCINLYFWWERMATPPDAPTGIVPAFVDAFTAFAKLHAEHLTSVVRSDDSKLDEAAIQQSADYISDLATSNEKLSETPEANLVIPDVIYDVAKHLFSRSGVVESRLDEEIGKFFILRMVWFNRFVVNSIVIPDAKIIDASEEEKEKRIDGNLFKSPIIPIVGAVGAVVANYAIAVIGIEYGGFNALFNWMIPNVNSTDLASQVTSVLSNYAGVAAQTTFRLGTAVALKQLGSALVSLAPVIGEKIIGFSSIKLLTHVSPYVAVPLATLAIVGIGVLVVSIWLGIDSSLALSAEQLIQTAESAFPRTANLFSGVTSYFCGVGANSNMVSEVGSALTTGTMSCSFSRLVDKGWRVALGLGAQTIITAWDTAKLSPDNIVKYLSRGVFWANNMLARTQTIVLMEGVRSVMPDAAIYVYDTFIQPTVVNLAAGSSNLSLLMYVMNVLLYTAPVIGGLGAIGKGAQVTFNFVRNLFDDSSQALNRNIGISQQQQPSVRQVARIEKTQPPSVVDKPTSDEIEELVEMFERRINMIEEKIAYVMSDKVQRIIQKKSTNERKAIDAIVQVFRQAKDGYQELRDELRRFLD